MADARKPLDYWRKIFSCTEYDIFELIEKAIIVAAADFPKEFKEGRGLIAEKLFASRVTLCSDCKRGEVEVVNNGDEVPAVEESSPNFDDSEEVRMAGEVMRIKEVLCKRGDESDAALYESLRSLQRMRVSVEALMATEIGRAVNDLRKHRSKAIRKLVGRLVDEWRVMVDRWVEAKDMVECENVRKRRSVADSESCCSSSIMASKREAMPEKRKLGKYYGD